jgi:uncharacterized protein (DUF2126 family)
VNNQIGQPAYDFSISSTSGSLSNWINADVNITSQRIWLNSTLFSRKLHVKQKEKQDRYSLIAQAEKQYGMPIAQIRQKYRNVPLDQLVKKESLYKKLLKALRS